MAEPLPTFSESWYRIAGQRIGTIRVIRMVVRHQDGGDRAGTAKNRGQMRRVVRAGVDDQRRPPSDDPRVRPLQRERPGVRREDPGGMTADVRHAVTAVVGRVGEDMTPAFSRPGSLAGSALYPQPWSR